MTAWIGCIFILLAFACTLVLFPWLETKKTSNWKIVLVCTVIALTSTIWTNTSQFVTLKVTGDRLSFGAIQYMNILYFLPFGLVMSKLYEYFNLYSVPETWNNQKLYFCLAIFDSISVVLMGIGNNVGFLVLLLPKKKMTLFFFKKKIDIKRKRYSLDMLLTFSNFFLFCSPPFVLLLLVSPPFLSCLSYRCPCPASTQGTPGQLQSIFGTLSLPSTALFTYLILGFKGTLMQNILLASVTITALIPFLIGNMETDFVFTKCLIYLLGNIIITISFVLKRWAMAEEKPFPYLGTITAHPVHLTTWVAFWMILLTFFPLIFIQAIPVCGGLPLNELISGFFGGIACMTGGIWYEQDCDAPDIPYWYWLNAFSVGTFVQGVSFVYITKHGGAILEYAVNTLAVPLTVIAYSTPLVDKYATDFESKYIASACILSVLVPIYGYFRLHHDQEVTEIAEMEENQAQILFVQDQQQSEIEKQLLPSFRSDTSGPSALKGYGSCE